MLINEITAYLPDLSKALHIMGIGRVLNTRPG